MSLKTFFKTYILSIFLSDVEVVRIERFALGTMFEADNISQL